MMVKPTPNNSVFHVLLNNDEVWRGGRAPQQQRAVVGGGLDNSVLGVGWGRVDNSVFHVLLNNSGVGGKGGAA